MIFFLHLTALFWHVNNILNLIAIFASVLVVRRWHWITATALKAEDCVQRYSYAVGSWWSTYVHDSWTESKVYRISINLEVVGCFMCICYECCCGCCLMLMGVALMVLDGVDCVGVTLLERKQKFLEDVKCRCLIA